MIIVSDALFIISDVLGKYYGMPTLSRLITNLSCHCDDSIMYKKKKKKKKGVSTSHVAQTIMVKC